MLLWNQPSSSPEPIYQPQHKAEQNAENDARGNREENSSVLSPVADVTWQTSEWHVRPSREHHNQPNQDQQSSGPNEQLTERVHHFILSRGEVSHGL
jgi:hypothetical protein